MTRVCYDEGVGRMEISGHAGAGEYGHDLVCAAASILMLTLEEALERRRELFRPGVERRPGEAVISCMASAGNEGRCRDIMETVFTGYELLADSYPDSVCTKRIRARGKGK